MPTYAKRANDSMAICSRRLKLTRDRRRDHQRVPIENMNYCNMGQSDPSLDTFSLDEWKHLGVTE